MAKTPRFLPSVEMTILFGSGLSGLGFVGWVEQSDTHHLLNIGDGYRFAPPILRGLRRRGLKAYAKPPSEIFAKQYIPRPLRVHPYPPERFAL